MVALLRRPLCGRDPAAELVIHLLNDAGATGVNAIHRGHTIKAHAAVTLPVAVRVMNPPGALTIALVIDAAEEFPGNATADVCFDVEMLSHGNSLRFLFFRSVGGVRLME